MLVISRAAGQSLFIGRSTLEIRWLIQSVGLVVTDAGQIKEFEFTLEEVQGEPVITLEQARVKLMRIEGDKIVLAIDAPRSVHVSRGEPQRSASDRGAN